MSKVTIFLIILFLNLSVSSQVVEGFDLTKYPAKVISLSKRPKLNFGKLILTNDLKAKLKEANDNQPITFAGNYITLLVTKEDNSTIGYMVDVRTGIIYLMPFNKTNVSNQCVLATDVFDRYLFNPDSKLLVTSICKESLVENNQKVKQNQTFFFYLWNETLKKFDLIKKSTKERTVARE